ncbi:putative FAD-linked oxidoreductase [Variibacter gotjawalensis]|uniref:Putative FAD-linked oxidoreductase n=1 Tax=Variibacter gotjawalensis TaxID=1333996 RepID=A0A0S3PRF5_9BRAD|nr:FAD-binding protein [Variibacter gotjawalensis]NIK48749.1 glycolate oxidase FAD binding subunit [Variibacter gotjawalensis]RZS50610.1 glycolate oxidase FAD binding subunit [Variibacter gotjawalensis]BAT58444.1 putative FAD-linked oxidoreductase [Variibacter gotjawalensis]
MTSTLKPRDANDVQVIVRDAVAGAQTLEIIGQGSKRTVGRPAQWDLTLDLSTLSGVTMYEPAELVLSAQAATPIAEIERLVAESHQELAFEPMDLGPVLGLPAGAGTIGGVIAANLSGPRRIKAGAARDHFLGFTAVSGRAETFKSGGRVVKNVTGYDLSKLMAGSWGTLAVMTDVTVKVLPRAETEATIVVLGLDDVAAVRLLNIAMGSAGEVSAAAFVPAGVADRLSIAVAAGRSVTALRLEGVPPSIAHRRAIVETLLGAMAALVLTEQESRDFWRGIRDALPFAAQPGTQRALWRISVPPMSGPDLAHRIRAAAPKSEFLFDWAGGLVWAEIDAAAAGASIVHRAVAAVGGHATLIRAPASVRAAVDVFDPQNAGVALLSKRIKENFDPKGVLGPGRMYAGV